MSPLAMFGKMFLFSESQAWLHTDMIMCVYIYIYMSWRSFVYDKIQFKSALPCSK